MATFDVNKALKDGYTMAEIQNYMSANSLQPKKTIGGFVSNIGESAVKTAQGIVQPLTQPVQTAKDLGNLVMGVAQLAMPGTQDKEKFARALGQFYLDRYGSFEKAANTIYQDPVGVVADISTVIGGGAGVLKAGGQATKISGLTKAGRTLEALTPEATIAKGIGKVTPKGITKKIGTKIEQTGKEYALRGIRPSQSSIKKFSSKYKTPLEDWVAKQGLTVDQLEELRNPAIPTSQTSVIEPLYTQRKLLLKQSGQNIPLRDVYYSILDKIDELRKPGKGDVPANMKLAQDLENYLTDFIQRKKETKVKEISLSDIDDLRSQFDRATKESEFMQSPDTSFNRIMGDTLRKIVNEKAGTTDIGRKISQFEDFAEIARKAPSGKGNIPLGLGTGVYMRSIESVPVVGPLITAGVREYINAPKTVQRVSQATQRIGRAMQKKPKASKKTNIFKQAVTTGLETGKATRLLAPENMQMEEETPTIKKPDRFDLLLQQKTVEPKVQPQTKTPTTTNAFAKVKKLRKGAFV